MSREDQIAAKAAAMSARRRPVVLDDEAEPAPARSTQVRVKPVRRTVDLSPQQHKDLSRWCDETAEALEVTRVTGQDVLVALVARLLVDDVLADQIHTAIANELHRRQARKNLP
jgi:hypothetical protein